MSKDRVVSTGSRIKEEDRIKEQGQRVKEKTRKMKDSGVEWIGKIPEDWEVKKLGNISSLYIGNSIRDTDKDNYIHPEDAIPYIATKDVSLNNKINYKNGMYIKNNDRDFRRAYKGSSLICIEGGSAGKKIAQVMTECCFGNKLCCVDSQVILNNFLYYYLLSPSFNNSFNARITGLIPGVTLSELGEIEVVVPTKDNQRKIANFLDGKVSLIDDTIEKTKQSIEDYKKYKQALITETVTKGLNPDVEMKDSGVEWIGEIPEDWEVIKLRYLGALQNGISKSGDEFGYGSPFVSYSDVYKNYSLPPKVVGLINSTREEKQVYSVQKGDVFFTRTSETIEEVGFSSTCLKTIEDAVFAGFVIRFRPFTRKLNENFSKYYFRSELHRRFFVKEMDIVTRASLSQELLKKLPVIIPPVLEQQQIADYLDNKCSEIDKIISEKEKLIKDLEIYKKSLIYEYVTGKRQV